jgi:hypothetical protein
MIESARLIWRNFEGKAGPYNVAGTRSFNVIIPEDVAQVMAADGWNVKLKEPREEDDEPFYFLPVAVAFDGARPPQIFVMPEGNLGRRTRLDADAVSMLDWANIVNADLMVRPYEWTTNGKSGIKAYLQSLYVVIEQDPLAQKYDMDPADD